jgi:hypothetical protein
MARLQPLRNKVVDFLIYQLLKVLAAFLCLSGVADIVTRTEFPLQVDPPNVSFPLLVLVLFHFPVLGFGSTPSELFRSDRL